MCRTRIELSGRSFIRYFSEIGSIFKKVLHLKPVLTIAYHALMPVTRDKMKPSSKSVCDRHTHRKSNKSSCAKSSRAQPFNDWALPA